MFNTRRGLTPSTTFLDLSTPYLDFACVSGNINIMINIKKGLFVAILAVMFAPSLSFAAFDNSLRYGSKGQDVQELQEFLVEQGYLNHEPTGSFYALTLKAVKAFQLANNLPSTGYWGVMSRTKANELISLETSVEAEQAEVPVVSTTTTPTVTPTVSPVVFGSTLGSVKEAPKVTKISLFMSGKEVNSDLIMTGGSCQRLVFDAKAIDQYGSPINTPIIFTNPETKSNTTSESSRFVFSPQTTERTDYVLIFSAGDISVSQKVSVYPTYSKQQLENPLENGFRFDNGNWIDTRGSQRVDITKGTCE